MRTVRFSDFVLYLSDYRTDRRSDITSGSRMLCPCPGPSGFRTLLPTAGRPRHQAIRLPLNGPMVRPRSRVRRSRSRDRRSPRRPPPIGRTIGLLRAGSVRHRRSRAGRRILVPARAGRSHRPRAETNSATTFDLARSRAAFRASASASAGRSHRPRAETSTATTPDLARPRAAFRASASAGRAP